MFDFISFKKTLSVQYHFKIHTIKLLYSETNIPKIYFK